MQSRWHQLPAPQILWKSILQDCGANGQHEPEAAEGITAVEDILFGACAQVISPQGLQPPPPRGPDSPPDKDSGEAFMLL